MPLAGRVYHERMRRSGRTSGDVIGLQLLELSGRKAAKEGAIVEEERTLLEERERLGTTN